ncbi:MULTISPECIES: hypothetical protein [Pseudomonas]|uniref:hypothetical protein n=1 Tax=Pseudomonas guariconensis TaxID=1288410 RepID=UPI002096856D|nr:MULTISPECIES: hypothetical protein [Pseudomonas]MCO7594246.1 hypothetical protein [Pseudomonas guariconensis]MCU7220027.1 hypothetical protein [Pseudomonas brassicacearum]
MNSIQRITFTQTSLEHALDAVSGLHEMSTELIAREVFRLMQEQARGGSIMPITIWCSRSGLYPTKLDAARNGEQQVAPAVLIGSDSQVSLANTTYSDDTTGITDALPTVAVEGDQLVIRITTECLLHAVTCSPEWPTDEAGSPISITDDQLLLQEIIHELQREDEQGTNPMHRLFDEAALNALNNGSQAVDYDEAHP